MGDFCLEAALLDEVKQRGEEREQKGGVGGEKKGNMEEDPAGVDHGKAVLSWPGRKAGTRPRRKQIGRRKIPRETVL